MWTRAACALAVVAGLAGCGDDGKPGEQEDSILPWVRVEQQKERAERARRDAQEQMMRAKEEAARQAQAMAEIQTAMAQAEEAMAEARAVYDLAQARARAHAMEASGEVIREHPERRRVRPKQPCAPNNPLC